jgi:Cu-processing system ATP-binding protein
MNHLSHHSDTLLQPVSGVAMASRNEQPSTHDELQTPNFKLQTTAPMLITESLVKQFGKLRVLDNINVQMARGQVVSLIGPNGSGKTTFLKCLLGLVIPDSGKITFDGESMLNNPALRRRVGYMPQISRLPENMRVAQLFDMIRDLRRDDAQRYDDELIKAFDVASFANKNLRTLSGGTRQKVGACLAFMFDPEVLILDEPTAGLDPVSAEILKEKVLVEKKKGKLVLLTSHILSDLDELSTHVMYLNEGNMLFFQSMEALKEQTGESKLTRAIAEIMKQHA